MLFPDGYVPLNGCRICGIDFTSLRAFDAHLGGTPEKRFHRDPARVKTLESPGEASGVRRFGLKVSEIEKARLAALAA